MAVEKAIPEINNNPPQKRHWLTDAFTVLLGFLVTLVLFPILLKKSKGLFKRSKTKKQFGAETLKKQFGAETFWSYALPILIALVLPALAALFVSLAFGVVWAIGALIVGFRIRILDDVKNLLEFLFVGVVVSFLPAVITCACLGTALSNPPTIIETRKLVAFEGDYAISGSFVVARTDYSTYHVQEVNPKDGSLIQRKLDTWRCKIVKEYRESGIIEFSKASPPKPIMKPILFSLIGTICQCQEKMRYRIRIPDGTIVWK